ncbi:MAG: Ig-like domain repeat protein [Frankiales bacterium]|nr:Ig-like domain repeat protein [Frankiales bacterium]
MKRTPRTAVTDAPRAHTCRRAGSGTLLLAALVSSLLLLGPFAAPVAASGPTTNCQLTALNDPVTVGHPATFRFFAAARVPEDLPPSPSGLVTFFDGLGGGVLGVAVLFPAVLKDNNSVDFSTSSLSLGHHTVYAILVGPSGPCPVPPSAGQQVDPPPASPSSTGVGSSANPSRHLQDVTLTATVARQSGGAVAGTVQFQADGAAVGGPQVVDGGGQASVHTSSLPVGDHPVTAAFTSSASDTLDSSGSLGGGQTVQPADTRTAVSTSRDPSELGQAVTFTAQVETVSPGAGTPVGTVQFSDGGTAFGPPLPLDGAGRASTVSSDRTVGAHTISATYTPSGGDENPSSGSVSQTVERARTTLTYDGPASGDFHDPTVVSATLTRTDDGSPLAGRSVQLTVASSSCDALTDAAGRASCTITPQVPAGASTVTAVFAGDAGSRPSADSRPFTVTREQTSLRYTGDTVIADGATLHASAVLREDDGLPALAGRSVTFTAGSGPSAQTCTGLTDPAGRAACDVSAVAQPLGPGTVKAAFAQDAYYLASADSASTIVYAFPSRGVFAVGDTRALPGATVTFYGAQWATANPLSAGAAPNAFKGFTTTTGRPACGAGFTADPGGSGLPPASVPSYTGTLVTSRVTASGSGSGSAIVGTVVRIVVVRTSTYGPTPGAGGTGTVVATVC